MTARRFRNIRRWSPPSHLAHLAVEETVYEPMAAAYACLIQEARARGVALLDMGIDSTDLVIYDGDACCSPPAFRYGPTI